jgi:hypothetical protein
MLRSRSFVFSHLTARPHSKQQPKKPRQSLPLARNIAKLHDESLFFPSSPGRTGVEEKHRKIRFAMSTQRRMNFSIFGEDLRCWKRERMS